jgi:hypothetical protein
MQSNLFDFKPATPPPALTDRTTPDPPLRVWERPKPKGEIAAAIPPGYGRIKDGPLLDDDLVWSYSRKEFLRNDSDLWTDAKPATVDGLIYVVRSFRSGRPDPDRTYTINRGP